MINWFHRLRHRAAPDELAEEMRLHREERVAELEAEGKPSAQARQQAEKEFGNALRLREESRDAWHLGWLEDLAGDLKHGLRGLARDRSFTIVSIASLALAIGVNTVIFSLAMEFFFSSPSVRDASTVLNLRLGGNSHTEPDDVRALREARIFSGIAGLKTGEINWREQQRSTRLFAVHVTGSYFPVLGVPLESGRGIAPGDRQVAVVSRRFWRLQLGSDPGVLGRVLWLDGVAHTIIGLLPEDHRTLEGFGFSPHVWIPADENKMELSLFVRLRDGMSRQEAFERLRAFAVALDQSVPRPRAPRADGPRLTGITGLERTGGKNLATALLFLGMLLTAVNLVLLIACVNVAGLLVARGQARAQEFAVRASLGAGRGRLIRQLLAETLLLALAATVAGVSANLLLTRLLSDVHPPLPVPIYLRVHPDWRLIAYAAGLALMATLAAGLPPAWQTARASLLQRGNRQTAGGGRLRSVLVGVQVTVTFVVLAGAFLFIRSLAMAAGTAPGIDVDQVLWASVRPADGQTLSTTTLERLKALPGVEAVSRARVVPFNDQTTHGGMVHGEGVPSAIRVRRQYNRVTPDYFRTMGIPLLSGRDFLEREQGVAIINETFARKIWGRLDVAGRTLRMGEGAPVTIIGVCRTAKYFLLSEDDQPAMYQVYDEGGRSDWMIRVPAGASGLVRPIETLLLAQDPAASIEVRPMNQALGMAMLPSQIGAGLMGSLGLLGLALASLGLYGVMLHTVARRRREIGVRIALGAGWRHVSALVAREIASVLGFGLLAGILVAVLVTRPLADFLIAGLSPTDPLTYAAVALVFAAVATVAATPAVVHALRVDPSQVLRVD